MTTTTELQPNRRLLVTVAFEIEPFPAIGRVGAVSDETVVDEFERTLMNIAGHSQYWMDKKRTKVIEWRPLPEQGRLC